MVDLRDRLIGEPCVYILFPEGTRTRSGEMGPFRPGIGMLAADTNVPVIPCFLKGTRLAFPPDRIVPRWKKISMSIGEPMYFDDVENNREGWNAIAAGVEARIRQLAVVANR
jgi:1-acyl-sn-glycerol-3-phosphate acyltransferase